jgi:TPR repeat protein
MKTIFAILVTLAIARGIVSAGYAGDEVHEVQKGADLYNAGRYSEALSKFMEIARLGNSDAQRRVATMYAEGKGTPRDYSQAIAWYRKSAAQGDLGALNELGELYETNPDKGNLVLAYAIYSIGAYLGGSLSVEDRDRLEKRLSPEQLSEAQRLSSGWRKGLPLPK